jgi:pilus assembly protein CpaB
LESFLIRTAGRSRGTYLFAGVSAALAVIAAIAVVKALESAQSEVDAARRAPETVPVVVATRDVDIGYTFTKDDVAITHLVPEMVPEGLAFHTLKEVTNRTARTQILANEIVRKERVAMQDGRVGLNALLLPGYRAMTVTVDQESGMVGLIQPENFVDVIVTIRPDDQSGHTKWLTETILENIRVIYVDTGVPKVEKSKDGKRISQPTSARRKPAITLELLPEQTEKLALSVSKGDIHLVLRGESALAPTGDTTEGNSPLSTSDLIGYRKPRGRRSYQTAEVIQGGRTETARFDRSGNRIER